MSKFETNLNFQMTKIQNRFVHWNLWFRYSDLFSPLLHENRLKLN
jgi:hypothetical protein